MFWIFLMSAGIIALDQITKSASVEWLTNLPGHSYELWEGVLHLAYVENRGAAFGMMQGARWFFLGITAVTCIAIVIFMLKERNRMHLLMKMSFGIVLAGAIGNLIDRAVLGYVRDMIYVAIIDFPVFNVADIAVCVGCGLLILDILFFKGKTYFDQLDKPDKKEAAEETEKNPAGGAEE